MLRLLSSGARGGTDPAEEKWEVLLVYVEVKEWRRGVVCDGICDEY